MIGGAVDWFRANVRTTAMTAAGTLVVLQLVLPTLFDSLVSVTLLGLGWLIGKTEAGR